MTPAGDDIVRRHEERDGGRVPLLVVDPLMKYLERLGLASGEPDITPLGDGHSNVTYALSGPQRTLVLRRPPRPPYPPGTHDVLREARLLSALGAMGARVPEVLAMCDDESVIGAPFYVTAFVDGYVFERETPQPLVVDDGRERIADEIVDVLIAIHALDWQSTVLARPDGGAGYLERQVRRFAGLLDGYRHREIPPLDRLTEWLAANVPETPQVTIVHGDYRLGNVMFAREGPPRLVAVLDWEMATIGDPLADLGYLCAMWGQPGDPDGLLTMSLATTEPGYPTRDELAHRYADRSGRSIAEIGWYMTLALWKFCIIMEGLGRRAHAGGSDDALVADFVAEIPAIAEHAERLARQPH